MGDFEPSIIRTKDFEVGIKKYQKGDKEQVHFHKLAEEITTVVNGAFKMKETILRAGDIARLKQEEKTDFECIEDGATVVIKMPSVVGDKYIM